MNPDVYKVIVDTEGCAECRGKRTWCILDPTETASATSYGNEDEATEICELMNEAYWAGHERRDDEVKAALV
jgi:hypothetical protein